MLSVTLYVHLFSIPLFPYLCITCDLSLQMVDSEANDSEFFITGDDDYNSVGGE